VGADKKGGRRTHATERLWSAAKSVVARGLEVSDQSVVQPITRCELPDGALLRTYVANGAYADCFAADIATSAPLAAYVEAFYTTIPFKLERLVLALLVAKPSSDADARRLASGETESFAAWSVEARAPGQILLCDYLSRTRSWLMIAPIEGGGARLYFGSAIVPVGIRSGRGRLGFPFNALLGFHTLYSRILLGAARSRLVRLLAFLAPQNAQTKTAERELRS
jgi:hypothetical protein